MSEIVGARIAEVLEERGMTQRALAEKVGVTEVSISRYINGTREPKASTLSKIATALKTTADRLLGIDDGTGGKTRNNTMGDYISRDEAIALSDNSPLFGKTGVIVKVEDLKLLPAAEVVEVHAVIDRMNEERKRAKGNWHTDPYWLGWVDAMRRAQRIVDGTIDDEPMYAPSTGEKEEKRK